MNATPNSDDRARAKARASEWLTFRRQFAFSQAVLAQTLGICRRTVCSVEGGEVIYPLPRTLRKFSALKDRCERAAKRRSVWAEGE